MTLQKCCLFIIGTRDHINQTSCSLPNSTLRKPVDWLFMLDLIQCKQLISFSTTSPGYLAEIIFKRQHCVIAGGSRHSGYQCSEGTDECLFHCVTGRTRPMVECFQDFQFMSDKTTHNVECSSLPCRNQTWNCCSVERTNETQTQKRWLWKITDTKKWSLYFMISIFSTIWLDWRTPNFCSFQKSSATKEEKDSCVNLGFLYYIILAKLIDIDPKVEKGIHKIWFQNRQPATFHSEKTISLFHTPYSTWIMLLVSIYNLFCSLGKCKSRKSIQILQEELPVDWDCQGRSFATDSLQSKRSSEF